LSVKNLGAIYLARGDWKDAEPLLTEAVATNRRQLGTEHPRTIVSLDQLAQVFGQQGRYKEAEAIRREVLAIRLRQAGPDHPGVAAARESLAQNLINQDEPSTLREAEHLLVENLDISRRVNGERSRTTGSAGFRLGSLYAGQGRYAEAEALFVPAIDALRESLGSLRPLTLDAIDSLGYVYLQERKYANAERVLRELLAAREKAMPQSWHRFDAQSMLGGALLGQRRFAEAEPLIVGGYEHMHERIASIPAYNRDSLVEAGQRVVDLYTAWGKPAQAAEWRRKIAS
jgi:tetratricopeptide (TPR) repeat protein